MLPRMKRSIAPHRSSVIFSEMREAVMNGERGWLPMAGTSL